jgi:hypothetical protein
MINRHSGTNTGITYSGEGTEERMDVNATGDASWTLGNSADGSASQSRDPATAMAQGIVLGALGGIGLWALVGAVIVSIF